MNRGNALRVFVETLGQELVANGIFAEYVADGRLKVEMCWTSSGAISSAETILLSEQSTPVALILNCVADPQDLRRTIRRILFRDAAESRWHIALAIPDMATWLMKEPQFAESFRQSQFNGSPLANVNYATHLQTWLQAGNQFDRSAVSQTDEEFAALNRYIEQHVPALAIA